uniref:Transcription initiation factor TFIID component TAF4 C-terminal domain-containing protein n=1 Tax=Amphimedon queenslandica TaxID=400682 RepID=A0A1X7SZ29_AMPQE
LKVLERIDEVSATRKQEREKEKIICAAKSRSKQDDPELAKMKEQAKQIQIAEEREIHQKAANVQAQAAIGRRKRTVTTAFGGESSSSGFKLMGIALQRCIDVK